MEKLIKYSGFALILGGLSFIITNAAIIIGLYQATNTNHVSLVNQKYEFTS